MIYVNDVTVMSEQSQSCCAVFGESRSSMGKLPAHMMRQQSLAKRKTDMFAALQGHIMVQYAEFAAQVRGGS